jgi:hypothetical protein
MAVYKILVKQKKKIIVIFYSPMWSNYFIVILFLIGGSNGRTITLKFKDIESKMNNLVASESHLLLSSKLK